MNCVLNMNTRAPGISIHQGAIKEIFYKLINSGHKVLQVPCPESAFIGLKRWWFTKEMYDSIPYREHSRKISSLISSIIQRFYEKGDRIIIVGLSLSPSCGVFYTQSDPSWEGRPFDVGLKPPVVKGKGVFIEELELALKEKNVNYKIVEIPPAVIYPEYRVPHLPEYPNSYEESLKKILNELELA